MPRCISGQMGEDLAGDSNVFMSDMDENETALPFGRDLEGAAPGYPRQHHRSTLRTSTDMDIRAGGYIVLMITSLLLTRPLLFITPYILPQK